MLQLVPRLFPANCKYDSSRFRYATGRHRTSVPNGPFLRFWFDKCSRLRRIISRPLDALLPLCRLFHAYESRREPANWCPRGKTVYVTPLHCMSPAPHGSRGARTHTNPPGTDSSVPPNRSAPTDSALRPPCFVVIEACELPDRDSRELSYPTACYRFIPLRSVSLLLSPRHYTISSNHQQHGYTSRRSFSFICPLKIAVLVDLITSLPKIRFGRQKEPPKQALGQWTGLQHSTSLSNWPTRRRQL